MKDISIYFSPKINEFEYEKESVGEHIITHKENDFPELEKNSIAIFHCPEYRNDSSGNRKLEINQNYLEPFLSLNFGENWNFKIYDLGIIHPGNEIKDTYFAIQQVISELIKENILPILVGGSQDLTFAMYQAYQHLEQLVNLTTIDSEFNLGNPDEELKSNAFISQILMHRPCFLFNVATIGVQAPYVKKSDFDLFEKLYFDVCRLGEFNANFKIAEPILRNTDLLSMDLNSIKNAEFHSVDNSPNGFYTEQVCQIAKYAGISDKLTSFALFSSVDTQLSLQQNGRVLAEIIWYFLDGFSQRKGDFPIGTKKDYTKFIVHLDDFKDELVFYKSPKSNRWWMEVPYPKSGSKYERHHLVPCNYEDYQAAMQNEMPDLWWKTYQKLV